MLTLRRSLGDVFLKWQISLKHHRPRAKPHRRPLCGLQGGLDLGLTLMGPSLESTAESSTKVEGSDYSSGPTTLYLTKANEGISVTGGLSRL